MKKLRVQQIENEVSDDKNPKFIFSMTDSDLLIGIATGAIDIVRLAKDELIARGLGKNRAWVGHKNAEQEWK